MHTGVNSVKPYGEQQELNDALSGLHVVYQEYERKVQRFGEKRKSH